MCQLQCLNKVSVHILFSDDVCPTNPNKKIYYIWRNRKELTLSLSRLGETYNHQLGLQNC